MRIVKINANQIKRSRELYEFDKLNNSIMHGTSNKYGAIGEVVIEDFFKKMGKSVSIDSTYDYDLVIDGYKVDVKTKKTTVEPEPHYYCSVADFNTEQDCDFYFFVRVMTDLSTAYLLGYLRKDEFYEKAVFKEKGELDVNGFKFKADCWNIEVCKLHKFKRS